MLGQPGACASACFLEAAPHALLPAVDVDEVWTDEGHPSLMLARSAFARVVWRNRSTASDAVVSRLQPLPNEVVARFQVQ